VSRPGAAIITRALQHPPLTGGLLPGVSCLWWRAPSPAEEWAHRDLLRRLLSTPEALTDDDRDDVTGLLGALVCGWWRRLPDEPDDGTVGEPVPVRLSAAAPEAGAAEAWPLLPLDWMSGHEETLLACVVACLGARYVAAAALAASAPPAPPDGCAAVATCLGWLAVERVHLPRLSERGDLRDRCLAAGVAGWLRAPDADDAPADPDWHLLAGDLSALVRWRWAGSAWEPVRLAVRASDAGEVWAGSLRAADVSALWAAGMGPALDAGALVRAWLPAGGGAGEGLRPLPTADGSLPWEEEPAWATLGHEARAWARAQWAWAWQHQAARSRGL
jgi:hypothetical protein